MKTKMILTLSLLASAAIAAKPVATVTSVTQLNDRARTLQVSYSLANGPAIVTCEFFTNATGGVSLPFGRIEGLSGDVNKIVSAAAGTITWPVRDYLDGEKIPADSFRVKLTAWPLSAPPPWCVVDPGESNAVAYYADESLIPLGGLTNALYKTRYIPMRRINAAGVEWIMGMSPAEQQRFPTLTANGPSHAVALTEDYYMSIYTFTRGQYKALNDGTAHTETVNWLPQGEDEDELPLASVSFSAMRGLGKRWPANGHEVDSGSILQRLRDRTGAAFDLPTEAQWEFACRAGTRSELNNGLEATIANANLVGWNYDNSLYPDKVRRRHRVGLKPANAWGLHDMHGNIWEVCLDRHPGASSATYWMNDVNFKAGSDVVVEPVGPAVGPNVASRGGGFNHGERNCRSAFRYYITECDNDVTQDKGSVDRGYRLVCPIPVTME